ncbi:MAG: tetratricopeptide repeat protein, partial [Proteobacteria bacterium]
MLESLSTKKLAAGVLIALGLSLGHVPSASAQAVDPKTRDMLIEKLTQVYLNLAPADSSKVAITLRLADLHAERARLDAMKELETGCTTCTAGANDRKKALGYYQEVLPKVQENSVGKVLAQVGHLYEMTGNEKDAIATYERILKDPKSASAKAEANVSLAEVYFKRRDYAQAKKNYQAVLENPSALSKGLAAYRIAWCEFNEGHLDPAINGLVTVLKTPELSARTAAVSGVAQIDKQFQEEVSRDLATFMARRTATVKDAALLYDVSPESAKISNVTFLASELERLGQAQASIDLWRFAQEKQSKPEARLEGLIRLAQLEMEQKQLPQASKDYESALSLWTTMGTCNEQDCAELKARLRKFVTDWNRTEKAAPSEALLNAYQAYLKTFSNESDMYLWAGKVASDLKQYALAVELSQKAA